MKKLYPVIALFCLSATLFAQSAAPRSGHSAPAWELAGGYQFARVFTPCCSSFGGFSASIQENKTGWFGGIFETGSSFHSVNGVSQRIFSLTAGPQFVYRKSSRLQPFVRAMIGGENERTTRQGVQFSETSFALDGGGGFDLRLTPRFYLRTKADFLHSSFSSQTQEQGQAGLGVVYRMGSIGGGAGL